MSRFLADFARQVEAPEFDLAKAALTFAREEFPDLRPALYLQRLDELAAQVAPRVATAASPFEAVRELCRFLFEEKGFAGNDTEYYDASNSFLNCVIDRGVGIPISLSVILMEVARRLFLPLRGVGLPGHFLVKLSRPEGDVLFDAFRAGLVVSPEDCQRLLDQSFHGAITLTPEHLAAVEPRDILARMLQNLKGIYFEAADHARLHWVLDYLLVLRPDDPRELRHRGEVRFRLGLYPGAEHDLTRALSHWPASDPGRAAVEASLATVQRARRSMN